MRLLHWLRYPRSDSPRRSRRPGCAPRSGAHLEGLEARLPLGDALLSHLVSASWLSDDSALADGELIRAAADPLSGHQIASWRDAEPPRQRLSTCGPTAVDGTQPGGEHEQRVLAAERGRVWEAAPWPVDGDAPGRPETSWLHVLLNLDARTEAPSPTSSLPGAVASSNGSGGADPGAVLAARRWVPTSDMNLARVWHTATRLDSGLVLVVGGTVSRISAELYDAVTDTWRETAGPLAYRQAHTATKLFDGTVLVVGGTFAMLFDPTTETWSAAGGVGAAPIAYHTATLLQDGRVLVAGGCFEYHSLIVLDSAFVYDPASGWSEARSMNEPRCAHTATLLDDGKVLVAGGLWDRGAPTASAEIYDPVKGTWTLVAPMPIEWDSHTATRLVDGRVLVTSVPAAVYDPLTGLWSQTSPMNQPRYAGHAAVGLANGSVLVAGGVSGREILASAEVYIPETNSWQVTATMNTARLGHTLTELADGRALATGGYISADPVSTRSAEIFGPLRLRPRPVG